MHTPWGPSQSTEKIIPGFTWVTTAGHGGLLVTRAGAQRLTPQAQALGLPFSQGYLAFEEDCLWAVAYLELLDQGVAIEALNGAWKDHDKSVVRRQILACVSRWNLPYLEERGLEPDPEGKAQYEASYRKSKAVLAEVGSAP